MYVIYKKIFLFKIGILWQIQTAEYSILILIVAIRFNIILRYKGYFKEFIE